MSPWEWTVLATAMLGLTAMGLAIAAIRRPSGVNSGFRISDWMPTFPAFLPAPAPGSGDAYLSCDFDEVELPSGTNREGFIAVQPDLVAAAREFDVPLDLLNAIARTESNFKTNLTSSAGAQGLMQLMPNTAKGIFAKLGTAGDPFDPRDAARTGAFYVDRSLSHYEKRFPNDPEKAVYWTVASYNCGMGCVDDYLSGRRDVMPAETQGYLARVFERLPYFTEIVRRCE